MEEHEHHEGEREKLDLQSELGLTRRDLIKRGAIVGGTLVWVAPAIQSVMRPALADTAQKSPFRHVCCYCYNGSPTSPSPKNPITGVAYEGTQDGNTSGGPRDSYDACKTYCLTTKGYQHFDWQTSTIPFLFNPANGGCYHA